MSRDDGDMADWFKALAHGRWSNLTNPEIAEDTCPDCDEIAEECACDWPLRLREVSPES